MKCSKCDYYSSGLLWNRCAVFESEYFYTRDSCDAVLDDGKTLNINSDALREYCNGVEGIKRLQDYFNKMEEK